jgi:hypothetical protein
MSGYIGPLPVPQATQHREAFTATASQTSFATAGYTPQFIDVYLNGVKLAPADYTATNGSDVVLTTGAAASDILEYVAYTPFEVANQTFTGTTTTDVLTTTGAFTSLGIDDNATATTMTLNASGHVLVGTTEPNPASANVAGTRLSVINSQFSAASNTPVYINRITTDGTLIDLRKNGTTVGTMGVSNTDNVYLYGTAAGHGGVNMGTSSVLPAKDSLLSDGTTDLGAATQRWKDAYLSGGVYLGGTGAANLLSDYEEGTFTPSLAFGGGATGMIYTIRNGSYTKVGDRVFIAINMTLSNKGSSTGAATVGGLPFVAASGLGGTAAGAGAVSYFSSMTNIDGMPSVGINQGDSRCSFYDAGIGVSVASSLTEGNFAATTDIRLFLSYRV